MKQPKTTSKKTQEPFTKETFEALETTWASLAQGVYSIT